jgi:hypothetical protein
LFPEKTQKVLSNPAIQNLGPSDQLTSIILPDTTVDGAFDVILQGVTYVLHVGNPVSVPDFNPVTQLSEPTLKGTANLHASALKVLEVKRIVITLSTGASMPWPPDPPTKFAASSRVHLQDPHPTKVLQ